MEHLSSFVSYLEEECDLFAEVYLLPENTKSDIGAKTVSLQLEHITGEDAVKLSLLHFFEHKLHDLNQPGLMPKRLPGVLKVNTDDECELRMRIEKINTIKDELTAFIRQYSPTASEQFELTKNAIPLAIRKAIGRHIHTIGPNQLKSMGFSISKRTSMTKPQKRDYWIKKIERTRKNIRSLIDADSWMALLEIEERSLSSLPKSARLRVERPLRKSPIANITYLNGKKFTISAHSPLNLINDKMST